MKILVTGGAGFIGTNFVYHMARKGHEIVVLDKLTYAGGADNLFPHSRSVPRVEPHFGSGNRGGSVKLIVGDICDRDAVSQSLVDIDRVVHFAAESHVTRSEQDPQVFYKTNVEGTKIMIEESTKAGVKRFIHISTDEVYGSIKSGYYKETDKKQGDSQASSAYAKSKSLADDLAMDCAKQGQPIIVTRTTNNFGPWQFPEKALPRWVTNLILGKKIPLWGKGAQVRDWLYAPENAQAIEFVLERGMLGEVYNVAANNNPEITNKKMAELVCQELGKDPAEWIELIADPRVEHDFRYGIDTSKLKELGFEPTRDIEAQVADTVKWYQQNEDWWRKRKSQAEKIYR